MLKQFPNRHGIIGIQGTVILNHHTVIGMSQLMGKRNDITKRTVIVRLDNTGSVLRRLN